MTWMNTRSNRKFDIFDPDPSLIFLEDIAHALSNLCRYNGHCSSFYSVAEHCIIMSDIAPQPFKLLALMHDSAEAYMGDVIRPHKKVYHTYRAIEKNLLKIIHKRFEIHTWDEADEMIKELDNQLMHAEKKMYFTDSDLDWGVEKFDHPTIVFRNLSPQQAKLEFLKRYQVLREATNYGNC